MNIQDLAQPAPVPQPQDPTPPSSPKWRLRLRSAIEHWQDLHWSVTALLLVLIVIGIAVFVFPGWVRVQAWLSKPDAPAWVQAVGSVLAIFVAVIVPVVQAEQERKRRNDAEFERRLRSTAMAGDAVAYVSYVIRSVLDDLLKLNKLGTPFEQQGRPQTRKRMLHEISMLRAFCERFPITSMDNAKITYRFFGILEGVVSLEAEFIADSSDEVPTLKALVKLCRRFHEDFRGPHHQAMAMMYLPEHREY